MLASVLVVFEVGDWGHGAFYLFSFWEQKASVEHLSTRQTGRAGMWQFLLHQMFWGTHTGRSCSIYAEKRWYSVPMCKWCNPSLGAQIFPCVHWEQIKGCLWLWALRALSVSVRAWACTVPFLLMLWLLCCKVCRDRELCHEARTKKQRKRRVTHS